MTSVEIRAKLDEARAAAEAAEIVWGESQSTADHKAFIAASEDAAKLHARLRAAEKREAEERAQREVEARAADEKELARRLASMKTFDADADAEAAACVEDHKRLCERMRKIEARLQQHREDVIESRRLGEKLGRDVLAREVSWHGIVSHVKDKIIKASHERGEEDRYSRHCCELVSRVWLP